MKNITIFQLLIIAILLIFNAPAFASEKEKKKHYCQSHDSDSEHKSHKDKCKKLRVKNKKDLRFGNLAPISSGVITISPQGGSRSVSGNIALLDGSFSRAKFSVSARPNQDFTINLPSQVIISVGGRDLIINNLKSSPSVTGKTDHHGKAKIYVGGDLNLPQNAPDGEYIGQFQIDINILQNTQ